MTLTALHSQKVRQVEVLKAVRDESPSAVLVYASDKAMSVENKELPPELKVSTCRFPKHPHLLSQTIRNH